MKGAIRISESLEELFRSPRPITRANGPTKCGMYRLAASLAAALPAERRVSARRGWAGEKSSLFEHPVRCTPVIPDVQTNAIPGYPQSFSATCYCRD